jgi:hypothetical protein
MSYTNKSLDRKLRRTLYVFLMSLMHFYTFYWASYGIRGHLINLHTKSPKTPIIRQNKYRLIYRVCLHMVQASPGGTQAGPVLARSCRCCYFLLKFTLCIYIQCINFSGFNFWASTLDTATNIRYHYCKPCGQFR